MTQGVLPYKYEEEKKETGMTGLGGLPIYLDLASAMEIAKSIESHLHIKKRGWTDAQTVMSIIFMNLAGGDCVEDMRKLESDDGFCTLLRRVEQKGMKRRERRALERQNKKEGERSVPSPSALFRYLAAFHDKEQEAQRVEGKAFIPAPNSHLRGLVSINKDMAKFIQKHNFQKTATLDQDATLVETSKQEAKYSYKGYQAYQPLNTWWSEQAMVLHTEFRDGNVPAGYEQRRVFKEALSLLPAGIEEVRLRSDTAGYQHDLLRYCEKGENERFGRIEFAIGCDVTPAFKSAVWELEEKDWQPIYKDYYGEKQKTNQQWAEVCFVPSEIAHSKHAPVYRYIAIREDMGSADLPELDVSQMALPFPTMKIDHQNYKIFGVVTNMDWDGEALIHWHRKRCGKSEEAHAIMKDDFAGGKLPSGDFGENAAWWWFMVLAMNINIFMKRLALGESWVSKRMKAIRFSLINIPGRIVRDSCGVIIRLVKDHPVLDLFLHARSRIMALVPGPSG